VEYLFDPRAPEAVLEHAPEAQLVAVVREPVERAISAVRWHMRKDKLPLLDTTEVLSRVVAEYRRPGSQAGGAVLKDILERGFYERQLQRYLDRFDPQQILVLAFDEIRQASDQAIARVYRFLGVDDSFRAPSQGLQPKRASKHRWLVRLERVAPRSRIVGKVADRLHGVLSAPESVLSQEPDAPTVIDDLRAIYRPHVEKLRSLLRELPAENRPRMGSGELWKSGG